MGQHGPSVALGFKFTEIDVLVAAHREDDWLHTENNGYRTATKC